MLHARFTDITLRTLKPPLKGQFNHWDRTLSGFGCRVSQGGSKTFLLKHDNRRITIGRHPLVSLVDARQEAKRRLAEFTLGRIGRQSLPYSKAIELFLADKAKTLRPRTLAS